MLYLSGAVRPEIVRGEIPKVGLMLTPNMGNRPDLSRIAWAGDTGCFSSSAGFDLTRFLDWCRLMKPYQATCLFMTAPDVVGDAVATWQRSKDVLPAIRAMGYRAALVAQDGIERTEIDWDAFDVWFTGGSTAWKLSETAYALAAEAKARGKWLHMGRVNSLRRLTAAAVGGYDSADGTYLVFGPDKNLPRLREWLAQLDRQSFMILEATNPR
jgi:hypothetical protein